MNESKITRENKIFNISNYFIKLGSNAIPNKKVTNLKLQKLLYFAQALHLVKFGKVLFDDDIVAWQYGPVVETVYNKYKQYDHYPIPSSSEFEKDILSEKNSIFIKKVWQIYGKYTANELIELTHKHTPWIEAYRLGRGTVISTDTIGEFYKNQYVVPKQKYTVVDLFSGVGGFHSGLIKTDRFEIKLSVDFDKYCEEFHRINYPNTPFIRADISKLEDNYIKNLKLGEIDLLVGGPPCQGFSTIGSRVSSDKKKRQKFDPRNNLIGHYIRMIRLLKPKYFVMENVKGLLTYHNGEFFREILNEFKNLNYNINFKVLNAADYGVPQIRNRVFVFGNRIGYKNDSGPISTHGDDKNKYNTVLKAISDLAGKENKFPNHVPLKHTDKNIKRYKLIPEGGRMPEDKLSKELYRKNFGNTFKRLNRNEPSLTMVPGHNAFPIHPWLNRSLTVREAARIMTYPDELTFVGPRHIQCIQVGNSVPPEMARSWGEHIVNILDNYL